VEAKHGHRNGPKNAKWYTEELCKNASKALPQQRDIEMRKREKYSFDAV